MPEESKLAAFLAAHSLKILALVALLAVAVGVGLVFGIGWALVVAGGLAWVDLFAAGWQR